MIRRRYQFAISNLGGVSPKEAAPQFYGNCLIMTRLIAEGDGKNKPAIEATNRSASPLFVLAAAGQQCLFSLSHSAAPERRYVFKPLKESLC